MVAMLPGAPAESLSTIVKGALAVRVALMLPSAPTETVATGALAPPKETAATSTRRSPAPRRRPGAPSAAARRA
jgi:hypothetical protein